MQRLHEWKADILTLRDLRIIRQRHEGMSKRKQMLEQRMTSWYFQKSAEVIVSRKRAAPEKKKVQAEVSQKDEGLNVRMVKQSGSLWYSNNNRNT
ncbi:MAG: hypothetical protein HBSAPP01_27560 [Candidatus Brocadia sapporoensis]|nr:MAG: hypothetical protein HBSAPP01_27560 [Candidatus Brocadia sapporoensis]